MSELLLIDDISKVLTDTVVERKIDRYEPVKPISPCTFACAKMIREFNHRTFAWIEKHKLNNPRCRSQTNQLESLLYVLEHNLKEISKNDPIIFNCLRKEITLLCHYFNYNHKEKLIQLIYETVSKCWTQLNIEEHIKITKLFFTDLCGLVNIHNPKEEYQETHDDIIDSPKQHVQWVDEERIDRMPTPKHLLPKSGVTRLHINTNTDIANIIPKTSRYASDY